MEWETGELTLNLKTLFPEEKYRNKFIIGIQMLTGYKDALVKGGDKNYINFLNTYEKVEHATLLDFDRSYILYQAVVATKYIEGSTAECGVYKGGSSLLISINDSEKKHYAMDTFENFPDVKTDLDKNVKGDFSDVTLAEVEKLFASQKNIILLKGTFTESFKKIQDETFSFVYVDADLYNSTKECCEFFYPRLSHGGIMLFDDYLLPNAAGVKKAVEEFFSTKNEFPIVLPTYQAMMVKF
jgi:O-methyltransferase